MLRARQCDAAVMARSSSLEALPSCLLLAEAALEAEAEQGAGVGQGEAGGRRPRSSNDIRHADLSKLSGGGLSKSYNHRSVVRDCTCTIHTQYHSQRGGSWSKQLDGPGCCFIKDFRRTMVGFRPRFRSVATPLHIVPRPALARLVRPGQ